MGIPAKTYLYLALVLSFPIFFAGCFPGGVMVEGGKTGDIAFIPAATLTRGAPYYVLCYDEKKAEEEREAAIENGDDPANLAPPVTPVIMDEYKGGCEVEGASSTYHLFNAFPATAPLNIEYAIGTAVQKLEGDTMINIRVWHEIHYYALLGRVSVVKVRGDVVRFLSQQEQQKRNQNLRRGRRRR